MMMAILMSVTLGALIGIIVAGELRWIK